jgi:hypothetical protein
MSRASSGSFLQQMFRSSLVVAGLLLVGVGVGDMVAGSVKLAQYEELFEATRPKGPRDPTALFPTATEGQERHRLARAKVAFYRLLVNAGQLLLALGTVLLSLGLLRLRLRVPRQLTSGGPPSTTRTNLHTG